MHYAEIHINESAWNQKPVFVGLIAEDPFSGQIKVVRHANWAQRVRDAAHRPPQFWSSKAQQDEADARECQPVITGVNAFLDSLDLHAEKHNLRLTRQSLAEILVEFAHRDGICRLSEVQSGDFKSLREALGFCFGREVERSASREETAQKPARTAPNLAEFVKSKAVAEPGRHSIAA